MMKVPHSSPSTFDHFAGCPQRLCLIVCCEVVKRALASIGHFLLYFNPGIKKMIQRLDHLPLKILKNTPQSSNRTCFIIYILKVIDISLYFGYILCFVLQRKDFLFNFLRFSEDFLRFWIVIQKSIWKSNF